MMPILILAAGASARMRGMDKLLMDVDGVPLLRRQAAMALDVSDDVRIALPARPHARYACVQDLNAQTIEVPDAAEGMSASLRAVFASLEAHQAHAMVLLSDLPDLTKTDLQKVITASTDHPDAMIWRGATQAGKGGHPMIVARELFTDFQSLTGDNGGHSIISNPRHTVHHVPLPGNRARQDLDTPEDWETWRANRTTLSGPE